MTPACSNDLKTGQRMSPRRSLKVCGTSEALMTSIRAVSGKDIDPQSLISDIESCMETSGEKCERQINPSINEQDQL